MHRAEPDPHPVAAGIAVVAVHALLLGGLVLGVDWRSDAVLRATVKLWHAPLGNPEPISKPEPAPRKPAPARRELAEPMPPPMVQAPTHPAYQPPAPAPSQVAPAPPQPIRQTTPPPEPQAAPTPPDIALAARAPTREPAAVPKAPGAPAPQAPAPAAPQRPEANPEQQRREKAMALAARLNEAEVDRQRLMLEEQQRHEESEQRRRQREKVARRLRELTDSMERERAQQRDSEAQASATQALIDDYIARISAKVRQRVILPSDLEGNPEAVFQVDLLVSGDVVATKLLKSSGSTAYDAAVQRAILAAQPLPVPEDPQLFHATFQNFLLSFRPKE